MPVLYTERLILRKIDAKDIDDIYEYSCSGPVPEYLLWSPHTSREQTKRYVGTLKKYYAKKEFYDWAVVLKENNKMIGTCGFSNIDEANLCAEIGYVLNQNYWGRGIAVEAAGEMLKVGFEQLGMNRIEGRYMIENRASARVMEKLVMQYEGVHRSSIFVKGQFRDIGYYALLAEDYKKAQGKA